MSKIVLSYLIIILSCTGSMENTKGIEKNNSGGNITQNGIQKNSTGDKELKIESINKFTFKVGDKDSSVTRFGYFAPENDAHTGVRGIAFDEQYVYLTDTWHRSIKKIDVQEGAIVASKTLNVRNKFTMGDITVFNDNLYVITDDTVVFVLDKNLIVINTLAVPQNYNKNIGEPKPIYWQTQDTLTLHPVFEHGKQLSDFRVPVKLIYIEKNNRVTSETKLLKPNELYYGRFRRSGENYIKGKKYEELQQDGKYYFKTDYGNLPLSSAIPALEKYEASINFDFNESTLVYFDMDATKLELTVIKYK